ncbi:concanavalin A-like lectin/glucanase domain-containing protein [Panaeolus papilionaceus]|nr:concanavalin A-like lectin/glucanase domain-containing protein [Panaeolus papilionaceus]
MPNFPLVVDEIDKLAPPSAKVASEGSLDQDATSQRVSQHSRSTSGNTSINVESPPVTPRSLTFNAPRTSFSSHSRPFYIPGSEQQTSVTPGASQAVGNGFPFPDVSNSSLSGINSVSTSVADLHKTASQFYGRTDSRAGSRPTSSRSREAFTLPRPRPTTMYSSVVAPTKVERERQKSTMLVEGTVLEKPWTEKRDPATRWSYLITWAALLIGVIGGAARCFFGYMEVPILPGNMCVVMDENFDSADGVFGDNGKFFREVDMSGFGNGEFSMATGSENNSYVKDGRLYITPTLTRDAIGDSAVDDGYVYNITGCTFNITQGVSYTSSLPTQSHNGSAIGSDQTFDLAGYTRACSAVSNITAGTIINPVQSARLTTRKSASIKYGRVEVRAKIPTGDWLWPAIWMLPVDNAYGPWPISGEIDIMEARGNGPSYPKQGSDFVRGSLNWGPLTWLNGVSKTFGWWHLRRGSYDQDFHTYALEWDKDFMRIYVDTRLHHMLDLRVKRSFFELGNFPGVVQNGTDAVILTNPWVNATKSAPFDQPFYLILNVAVGGTNGWFPDGNEKPWLDGSRTAMADFWRMRGDWLPTWPDVEKRSMIM